MGDEKSKFFVFVFPTQLQIIVSEPQTHKQILTLYNPYHFPIKFKVKCTNPKKYSVIEPQGILKATCSVDIIIRHAAAQVRTFSGIDTFRIEICPVHNETLHGSKDIPVRVLETALSDDCLRNHQSFPAGKLNHPLLHVNRNLTECLPSMQPPFERNLTSLWFCVGTAVVCAIALMLPTLGLDVSATIPHWLHLSVPQKLVFAYILGLVTLLVLRPG